MTDVHVQTEDPFYRVLLPPPDETPSQREKRVYAQQEALRISQEIDATLLESKKAFECRKKATKVLLLGQSESGKSTTLKNFQLLLCPAQFRQERAVWRMIIQLNLIRSVRQILTTMQDEWESTTPRSNSGTLLVGSKDSTSSLLTSNHRRIRMRLSPLISIEETLTRKLSPKLQDPNSKEIVFRGGSGWIGYLSNVMSKADARPKSSGGNDSEDATNVLSACREDIIWLWNDSAVQTLLLNRNKRIHEMPGFFLDDTERIAVPNYEPTDQDVMRARIKTIGVEEHRLVVEKGPSPGSEWLLYDVNGSRNVRSQWASFFDDMQSIIFLAPLTFNRSLEEDPHVNRLEDSILIWKSICANQLLAKTTLMLFLNKMDVLRKTLESGVQVKTYVPSYGDQPNEFSHVVKYFRDKFRGYHRKLSPKPRPFFWHETSVIDTKSTSAVLFEVSEGILRKHLEEASAI